MFSLAWPWALLALPLPWLLRALLPPLRRQQQALKAPFIAQLGTAQAQAPGRGHRLGRRLLLLLAWLALVLAAARPQWLGEPVTVPTQARDLLLAVDISGSMEAADMVLDGQRVDRLTAVKAVVSQFIDRRQQDRVGLILFGTNAYVQAPLTFDRETVRRFLREARLGFAGEKTAIGAAIGLAVKRLAERPSEQRVLILLTDGANTAGEIEPLTAAELAAKAGVTIYTIGIGSDSLALPGPFGSSMLGRRINPSADLDEASLQQIAELTGGRYFRARDVRELAGIYQELDQLEPIEQEQTRYRPQRSLYPWPLALAILVSLVLAVRAAREP